ncbi:MAG TPA: hypothetical protein VFJ58_19435 [Armatimonadota bacterium]|nr:hypothetical protein [Armatimonadota bacterium]
MIQPPQQLQADLMADTVAFTVLSAAELTRCSEFGTRCSIARGEQIFAAGSQSFDCYVIVSGDVCIVDLSTDEPTLGAGIWRAFQRRGEFLMATDFQGLRVNGAKDDKRTLDTVEFLYRKDVPHHWMNNAEEENATRIREIGCDDLHYPMITCGKRLLMRSPGLTQLAESIGVLHRLPEKTYDVIVLGSGPAGLGAPICASSEGLSTLVLDGLRPGGQAGSEELQPAAPARQAIRANHK